MKSYKMAGKSTSAKKFSEFPDISFHHKAITEREVGVVYVVYNDYHTKESLAFLYRGLEADCVNIERFFDICDDEYYVVSKRSVTAKRFLITCEHLANHTERYLPCCNRIIIYFAGHGYGDCIVLDDDCASVKDEGGKKSDNKTLIRGSIKIEDILVKFREKRVTGKMPVILLLDACCNAQLVNCEENELVASAASEKSKAKTSPHGGYWTNTLYTVFNTSNGQYNIVDLLRNVEERINGMYPEEATTLYPTFKHNLKREICFKKSMYIFITILLLNAAWLAMLYKNFITSRVHNRYYELLIVSR